MSANIECIKNGDYLIPNLTLPAEESRTLGKYDMLRKSYLKQHRKGLYSSMLLDGTLYDHLYRRITVFIKYRQTHEQLY